MIHNIEFRQVRTFEQKLNATFAFIRENFKPFLKTIIFIGGPAIILAAVGYGIFMQFYTSIFSIRSGDGIGDFFQDNLFFYAGAAILFALSAVASSILVFFSSGYFVRLYIEGDREITPGKVWERMKGRIFPFLGWMFLLLVSVGAILFAIAIIIPFFGSALLGVLSFLIFFAGYVYFLVSLSLMPIVYIHEEKSFIEALSRTFSLLKGNWWRTFGLLIIIYIIIMMLAMLLAIPQYAFTITTVIHSVSEQKAEAPLWMTIATAISSSVQYIGSTLLSALAVVTLCFHYFSLVEEKERRGLMDKISSIGESQNSQNPGLESY